MKSVPAICIERLNKVYDNGFVALKDVSLSIEPGEIFALLGPNGAGKTTLIGSVCGLVRPSSGSITVQGWDAHKHYKQARRCVGLVPQELNLGAFDKVINTVKFSRGLAGLPPDGEYIDQVLKDMSLYDKRDSKVMMLSGGMKRRLLIAKALSHKPDVLFLDEPTAGVDVDLRKAMWQQIGHLRERGVTIVLTTHYIEEAEAMADRVGIINEGQLILVQQKLALMRKLGKHQLQITLSKPLLVTPPELAEHDVKRSEDGCVLTVNYNVEQQPAAVQSMLDCVHKLRLSVVDISSKRSSLEEIFVNLLNQGNQQ